MRDGRDVIWTGLWSFAFVATTKEARQIPEPVSNTNQQNTGGTGDSGSPYRGGGGVHARLRRRQQTAGTSRVADEYDGRWQ